MKLSLPLALALALVANLIPIFGRMPDPQPRKNQGTEP
jgi:hypothetical protein